MNKQAKKIIEDKLISLDKSKFRKSFKLRTKELAYLEKKDISEIRKEAILFINNKLAPSFPKNDGAQTPMKNHPVFIAQHATATCCRKCLYKWHKIPVGRELSQTEKNFIVELIISWIIKNKGI